MCLLHNKLLKQVKLLFLEIHFKRNQLIVQEKQLVVTSRGDIILRVQLVREPIGLLLDALVGRLDLDSVLGGFDGLSDGAGEVFSDDEFVFDYLHLGQVFAFWCVLFAQVYIFLLVLDLVQFPAYG